MSDRSDDPSHDDEPVPPRPGRLSSEPTEEDLEERLRQARLSGAFDDADDAPDDGAVGSEGEGAPGEGPVEDVRADPVPAGEDPTEAEPTDGPGPAGTADEADAPERRAGRVTVHLDEEDDHVEDDLGAAATLPSGRRGGDAGRPTADPASATGTGSPAARGGRRRRVVGLAALAAVAVLLLAAVPLVAGTLESTPPDAYGLSYGGGPFEGQQFQEVVDPGRGLFFNGIGDSLYLYPADQRNYIVSGDDRDDEPADGSEAATVDASTITAPTRDRVQVSFQAAVYFKLNIDRLQQFHEELGLKYEAYTPGGWDRMIQDNFRQQVESALQEQARRHDVGDLFGDGDVLLSLQGEVEATLSERLEAALGADYFCSPTYQRGAACDSPTVVLKRIDVPTDVAAAFERTRTAAIDVEAREAEAEAIERLADALERAGDDYVLLKAIESGQITFWVLPDGGVSITAPDGSTGAPEAPVPDEGGG